MCKSTKIIRSPSNELWRLCKTDVYKRQVEGLATNGAFGLIVGRALAKVLDEGDAGE